MTWLVKLTLVLIVGQISCGILDLFNANSDYNLASNMDTIFASVENNVNFLLSGQLAVPVEESVTFWCSNGSSTTLKPTVVNDSLLNQKLDLSREVTFIIHGWLDDMSLIWFQQLVEDVLKYTGTNACAVNWGYLAHFNYYRTAVNHTMLVSEHLTKFVQFLQTSGLPLENVTMVGHSMGAQISGQVGYNLGGKIGKIYGLDPAGPCFTMPRDRGLQYRLDKSDAKFVQTIITSRFLIGVGFGDGHENFYPNAGTAPQPNCVLPLTSDAEFSGQILCSHMHSFALFRYSLNPANVYQGRQCLNWPIYLLNMCARNKANLLGWHSDKSGGDYFLRTSTKAPYTVS